MEQPGICAPCPTIEELQQVLAFEIQHINPLAIRLHKRWTDWPRPPLETGAFYQALLNTITDPNRHLVLRDLLRDIDIVKGKTWRPKAQLLQRVFNRADTLFHRLHNNAWIEAHEHFPGGEPACVAEWMREQFKLPECRPFIKVFDWLVQVEAAMTPADPEQSLSIVNGDLEEETELALRSDWDQGIKNLITTLTGNTDIRFSLTLVQVLRAEIDSLSRLADAHDQRKVARQSAALQRFGVLLDDVDALPIPDVALKAIVRQVRENLSLTGQNADSDLLASWRGAVTTCLTEAQNSQDRKRELEALLADASARKDYPAIAAQAQAIVDHEAIVTKAMGCLLAVFADIVRALAISSESSGLPETPTTAKENGNAEIEEGPATITTSVVSGTAKTTHRANQPFASLPSCMELPVVREQRTTPKALTEPSDNVQLPLAPGTEPDDSGPVPSIFNTTAATIEQCEFELDTPVRGTNSALLPPEISITELADAFHNNSALPADVAAALVWALVRDRRPALAYQLARSLEHTALAPLDANAFLALFLAQYIHGPADEVAEPLRDCLTSLLLVDFLNDRAVRHRRANSLIAFAATLRPALLAPSLTGARAVLEERHLPLDFASLNDLRAAIIDSSRLGLTLSEAMLKGQAGPGTWEHNLADLRKRCREWWTDHRHRRVKYAATAKVWQYWLEDNGSIGALLQAVAEDQLERLDQARREIEVWRDSKAVNRNLDLTDQELRGRNANLRPIDGSPRRDIARLAAEAMDFVHQWLALHATRPATGPGTDSPDLADWVQRTRSLLVKAKEDLSAALLAPKDLPDLAAIHAALSALDDLGDLLDPTAPMRRGLPWWKHLGSALLLDPNIPLDDEWRPLDSLPRPELLQRVVRLTTAATDWSTAFAEAQERCAHGATGRIIEALGAADAPPIGFENWRQQRDDSLEHCRKRLNDRIRVIASAVSHAVDSGYLDEEDRARVGEQLESCKDRQDGDIGVSLQVLDSIEDELRRYKQVRIEEERERLLTNESLSGKPELRTRIERLLERGELATAAEYVTHAENGEGPPSDDQAAPLGAEFFPRFLALATEQLASSKGGEVLRVLEAGRGIGPLTPPGADGEHHLTLLRVWLRLQGRRLPIGDAVSDLLLSLGFRAPQVEVDDSEPGLQGVFNLNTEPLQDRSVCIVPQYGSLARGHYRVVCIWDRIPAEELRKNLGPRSAAPTLVLYLNRMPENQRRELAYQCRQNRQTFLVLDEWLLFFLINGEPAARLATLFQCGFQFTFVNPYTPTSSDVPDEIFFGRRRAMDQIADLHGSNLVFGGRQLGKTALLREVKRRFHDLQRGFYVAWIDLKYEGIGVGRPLEEVWAMIGGELTKEGLVSSRISRPESVRREIVSWLDGDDRRRLLILLDEADELFAQDAKVEYKTLMGLKNLMEETNRRFKVVFAGLHNVQRMSRDVNSPVKHLSKPICVGPLLEDGESREAFRLISMPLRMLGYKCADDVVNTILSYTNYYPNLIQHYCHSLLENLNQERFDTQNTPPYEVSAEHVEQAYQRRDLRQFIRDRFQITLDLDPRYRVLALRIALETLEKRKSGEETASGFSVEWIRAEALRLWQVGFNDRTSEAFRTLLDEMVGLGLLRHAQRGYALRSPNIVNLLGAHDAIQQDLLDACEKEPPPVYTAATYRRALGDDQWQRSPLVAEQEYEILAPETGIVILFGTALAGIDRAALAISSAVERVPEAHLLPLNDLIDQHEFEKRLRAALDRQKAENLVVLVDHVVPWGETWVRCANQVLSHRRSKQRTARIVFAGDATTAWFWSGLSKPDREDLGRPRIMTLKPWAPETLRQWQRDTGIGPLSDADEAGITLTTGLWDSPMFLLGERVRSDPGNWRQTVKDAQQWIAEHRQTLSDTLAQAPGSRSLLAVMVDLDEALSEEDLVDLSDSFCLPEVTRLLSWADLLAFVRPEDQGKWRINPFVAHLLQELES